MDIARISMALANIDTKQEVGTAVLAKAMDTQEIVGDGIVKMIGRQDMEHSVNSYLGQNVDEYR